MSVLPVAAAMSASFFAAVVRSPLDGTPSAAGECVPQEHDDDGPHDGGSEVGPEPTTITFSPSGDPSRAARSQRSRPVMEMRFA
jgi:hypothetical protein